MWTAVTIKQLLLPPMVARIAPRLEGKTINLAYLTQLARVAFLRSRAAEIGLEDIRLPGCLYTTIDADWTFWCVGENGDTFHLPRPLNDTPVPARLAVLISKIYDQLGALIHLKTPQEKIVEFLNGLLGGKAPSPGSPGSTMIHVSPPTSGSTVMHVSSSTASSSSSSTASSPTPISIDQK